MKPEMRIWLIVLAALLPACAFAQTPTSFPVRDGAGVSRNMRGESKADNTLAPHSVPEVAGAAVSAANPLPVTIQTDSSGGATAANQTTGNASLASILSALLGTLTTSDNQSAAFQGAVAITPGTPVAVAASAILGTSK